jgi:hypothetical protein
MTAPIGPPRIPITRPAVPPEPHLTKSGCCSECKMRSLLIADGDLRICPKCFALLWHANWSANEHRARATAIAAAEAVQKEAARLRHELHQAQQVAFSAESLTTSAPTLGIPESKEIAPVNDDDKIAEELMVEADLALRIAEYLRLNGFADLQEAADKGWGDTRPLMLPPKAH